MRNRKRRKLRKKYKHISKKYGLSLKEASIRYKKNIPDKVEHIKNTEPIIIINAKKVMYLVKTENLTIEEALIKYKNKTQR
jgi:hypothetical protein